MDIHPIGFAEISLFKPLDTVERRALERDCTWRRYHANEVIIDDRDEGSDLYIVVRGSLRASVTIAGQEMILRDIRAGEYFGEISAIDGRPRSAHIHCITDSVVAKMSAPTFWKAMQQHPEVGKQVLVSLTGLIRSLTDRVNETSALSIKHRLWAELLRLSRPSHGGSGLFVISPPPTHAELAARIGSHREAVTRELNALARTGLITRRRGAILLQDRNRLRQALDKALQG